jgi:hypothetical protein
MITVSAAVRLRPNPPGGDEGRRVSRMRGGRGKRKKCVMKDGERERKGRKSDKKQMNK